MDGIPCHIKSFADIITNDNEVTNVRESYCASVVNLSFLYCVHPKKRMPNLGGP
jgi:hypothetical protein